MDKMQKLNNFNRIKLQELKQLYHHFLMKDHSNQPEEDMVIHLQNSLNIFHPKLHKQFLQKKIKKNRKNKLGDPIIMS
jgi:hypothetical protein